MSYSEIPRKATLKPKPFKIETPQKEVDDFYQLLKLSPLAPKTFENVQEDTNLYGVTYEWMSKAKEYWTGKYDW